LVHAILRLLESDLPKQGAAQHAKVRLWSNMIGFLLLMDVSIHDFHTHEALFDPVFLPCILPDRLWSKATIQNGARKEEAETLQCTAIRWHHH